MNNILEFPARDPVAEETAFRTRVELYKEDYRAKQIAQNEVRAELAGAKAPGLDPFTATLKDELAEPAPEVKFAVEQLATSGAIVSLPSPRKSGKTTLVTNLAESGVDGTPFLGRFTTTLDGNIAVVNAEMTKADYLDTYRKLGIKNTSRIIPLHCRDNGLRINIMDDLTVDRFITWLHKHDTEWMFLDPWKNFLAWAGAGINDNDMVNRMITRVQEIQAAAGMKLTVIPMHTPQNTGEPGTERAKGAGELEDSVDAMWRYVRAEPGIDAPRALSVEGRGGARLDETLVLFDNATGRLTLGEGDRRDAAASRNQARIIQVLKEHPGINTNELYDRAGGNRNTMSRAKDVLERQNIITGIRVGNSTVWTRT